MTKPDPKDDPGQVPSDPARRPGQPGAEREQVDDTQPEPTRGPADDRGIPVDGAIGEEVANEPDPMEADLHETPLSDGSVRAGPV